MDDFQLLLTVSDLSVCADCYYVSRIFLKVFHVLIKIGNLRLMKVMLCVICVIVFLLWQH